MTADRTPRPVLRTRVVAANGLNFTVREAGTGPLALCLHGFPDSAHTWQYLLPELARAGFHAAYRAAADAPDRWRRLVTLAVPPATLDDRVFADYDQLKRFFYFFLLQSPLGEEVAAAHDMAFLDRLWSDWSPGYPAAEALAFVKQSLRDPANLRAAIGYCRDYPMSPQAQAAETGPQPTLYLHGDADGCIGVELVRDCERYLAPGSRMTVVAGAGHFLHLEKPAEVNGHILSWLTS